LAIIAGIDEAGLGPVLGPLVVSAAAVSLPNELVDVSMWELLGGAVTKKPSARKLRKTSSIAIGDSKKLYHGLKSKAGLEHIERGVLTMLATAKPLPETLAGLLELISPGTLAGAKNYPWYCSEALGLTLPKCSTDVSLKLSANALKHRMREAEVKLVSLRTMPVFVGEFNRMAEATRNKSTVVFNFVSQLLMHIWQMRRKLPAGEIVRIYIDRQGGRTRYLPQLQRVLDGCKFKILEETDNLSAYRITEGEKSAEVFFATGAEDSHLPVALASMTSKYLRELLMSVFNSFWAGHVNELKPTAGYYTDGRRFFGEIQSKIKQLGLNERLIYRSR